MYASIYICIQHIQETHTYPYRVATISTLLTIIDIFCKKALLKRQSSAKETYILRSLLIVANPQNIESSLSLSLILTLIIFLIRMYQCIYRYLSVFNKRAHVREPIQLLQSQRGIGQYICICIYLSVSLLYFFL